MPSKAVVSTLTPNRGSLRIAFELVLAQLILSAAPLAAAEQLQAGKDVEQQYTNEVLPILESGCLDCHGSGIAEGGVSLDLEENGAALLKDSELWARVVHNVRAGIMPPAGYDSPTSEQTAKLAEWVKRSVIGIDYQQVDPGPVTLRRLNRLEYRNTIREMTGLDFEAEALFPPDDTGEGFDTVGDALVASPLLIEKYLQAADEIVEATFPQGSRDAARPDTYDRIFPAPEPPSDPQARSDYLRVVLTRFVAKAHRRPADSLTVDRLVAIAEQTAAQSGATFEQGVAQAAKAVLASPQFLFRYEVADSEDASQAAARHPRVDSYTLANRLSYFLWASSPDEELRRLADKNRLHRDLDRQVDRMLQDPRALRSLRSFVGQWLRVRDVMHVPVSTLAARGLQGQRTAAHKRLRRARNRDVPREKIAALNEEVLRLDGLARQPSRQLRVAMRREAEMLFERIATENRSLLELIDCDYTFVNEQLANHYGIEGVAGESMQRIDLGADSVRGGVLTLASTLMVTSNPTRTSPVKRGLFVLDNLLGTPPPPAPANIPELEEAAGEFGDREPTLRELLAVHRAAPLCSSCHERMDPIGLALENFDAVGAHRETHHGVPIDPSGRLISGETFAGVKELKEKLVGPRRQDFYRCVTEKMFVYALGRGMQPSDLHTIDQVVARLEADGGRFRTLVSGVIHSPQFQRIRRAATKPNTATAAAKSPLNR